ncbi:MAG: Rpn family recombination-promoting nuclease/putative transposase [Lachnospiraceae bacterium]|nr:Rpn family recombination-promoting nuclease/putative transposase [Lachnospiraceae bacterium]
MDYSELKFTNNFVFCKVLENNLDLCRELLELILDVKIKEVALSDKEKVLDITPDGKSVRLDIYVEDDAGTVYNIEMQVAVKQNLPKRSRYYQGMIDLNSIEKGAKYNALRKSYVIFICMFDPFDKNLPIYTFTNKCSEMPELELGDGTAKVFINPYGDSKDLSGEMKAFFKYLREAVAQSKFTERLCAEVIKVRENKEWRLEYMAWISALEESKEEAREEGREEGRREGRREGREEAREEGIKNIVEIYYKFNQPPETARAAIIEKYPDMSKIFIDAAIAEVYDL